MAENKQPWKRNLDGAPKPLIMPGLIQAGSTQEIKRGEICAFNETSGYWVPINAVADAMYLLAIANEQQKSDGLARYAEFIQIRPHDVFEFALAATRQTELGETFTLTASDSQTLTYSATGQCVAKSVYPGNYPEIGTTIETALTCEVIFNPSVSYFCNLVGWGTAPYPRMFTKIADYQLLRDDHGAIIDSLGDGDGVVITAPANVPVGWTITLFCGADQTMRFEPGATAGVYIKGAKQADGKYIQITDIADFITFIWRGDDWFAVPSIGGADGDISIEG